MKLWKVSSEAQITVVVLVLLISPLYLNSLRSKITLQSMKPLDIVRQIRNWFQCKEKAQTKHTTLFQRNNFYGLKE